MSDNRLFKEGIYAMQKVFHYAIMILLFSLTVITGCCSTSQKIKTRSPESQFSLQETQEAIQQAQKNFEVVNSLPVKETYSEAFQKAQSKLADAEMFFQKNRLNDAYFTAKSSLEASQHILRRFYQQTIAQTARQTKTEILEITEDDPDNPLQDFIPELNAILDFSDDISEGKGVIDPQKVQNALIAVNQIEQNTQTNVSEILGSDVSFASGRYELSEEGKRVLDTWSEAIIANCERFQSLYPEKKVVITLKVIGYTDQVDFHKGTRLITTLTEGITENIPGGIGERRRFFNQRLSEFRARTISEYFIALLEKSKISGVHIDQEIIGLGEQVPPGLSAPYPLSDPRRRICKVYSYITTQ